MKKVKVILASALVGVVMAGCAYHNGQQPAASTSGHVVHHTSHSKLGKLGRK